MMPALPLAALAALVTVPDLPAPTLACAIQHLHPSRKPADVALYAETHLRLARVHGLDPLLLAALAAHESDHRWRVLGPACEVGIYQVLPHGADPGRCLASPEVRRLRANRGALAAEAGVRGLVRRREAHEARCKSRPPHPWWAHHNWGYAVHAGHACRHAGYPARVEAEYRRIVKEVTRCTMRSDGRMR